jgi:hypothetical protein
MAVLLLLFTGCTADYTKSLVKQGLHDGYLIDTPNLYTTREWVIPGDASLYVAFPHGPWSIPLRRKMTAELGQTMNQYFVNVEYPNDPVTLDKALYTAKLLNAQYVLYPQLAGYTNKLSSFVEIDEDFNDDYRQLGFDRLVLLMKLYNSQNGKLIDVTHIRSRSGLISLERSTPSDLFKESFQAYAQSLVKASP